MPVIILYHIVTLNHTVTGEPIMQSLFSMWLLHMHIVVWQDLAPFGGAASVVGDEQEDELHAEDVMM